MKTPLNSISPVIAAAVAGALLALVVEEPYVPRSVPSGAVDGWSLANTPSYAVRDAIEFLNTRAPWGEVETQARLAELSAAEAAAAASSGASLRPSWRFVGISRRDQQGTLAHFLSRDGESVRIPVGEPTPLGERVVDVGDDWVEVNRDGGTVRLELFQPLEAS